MKPENIEILLEQICQGIDDLKATPKHSASSGLTEKDLDRIDGVEQSQALINHNVIKLTDFVGGLIEMVGKWKPVNTTQHHHEHVFFPGIIAWVDAVKRWKVMLVLAFLLVVSMVLNTMWYQQMAIYKVGFLKYFAANDLGKELKVVEALYEQDPQGFMHIVDSIYNTQIQREKIQHDINTLQQREKELR
jgi:hypothetical protein